MRAQNSMPPVNWTSVSRATWSAGSVALLALVSFVVAGTVSAKSASSTATLQSPRDAKSLFVDTFRCSTCHSVAAAGIVAKARSEKIRGSDLSGYKAKPGEDPILFLRKRAQLRGETHRVEFLGTDEELQAILDWLGSLEAQPGRG